MEKLSATTNSLNWFEIPVLDSARAKKFYEAIFEIDMQQQTMMGMEMTFFPGSDNMIGKVSGALVKSDMHKPSVDGTIVYLNANPSVQAVLHRVEPAGGKIVMPSTKISDDIGYMAFFMDTEGNRMALHGSGN